jgi:hypothetical protein
MPSSMTDRLTKQCGNQQLAPTVSHFTNGSDFKPCQYKDINALIELYLAVPADGSVKEPAQPFHKHKPDYSMTNAGLHIQLPILSFPAIYPAGCPQNAYEETYVYPTVQFAFLACKSTKRDSLIAICLCRNEKSNYLDYSRVSFRGKTLHMVNRSDYGNRVLKTTNFDAMWVRQLYSNNKSISPPPWPSKL